MAERGHARERRGVCVRGYGKSKALLDVLRRNYGIHLDLSTESRDGDWKSTVDNMKVTVADFNQRLTREKQRDGSRSIEQVVDAAFASFESSLRGQVDAVLLGHMVVLIKLHGVLGELLTPNIWALYQTTTAASYVFRSCTRAILQKSIPPAQLVPDLRKHLHSLLHLQGKGFPVLCEEFQVLMFIRAHVVIGWFALV
jgi:hypothetical protein